MVLPKYMLEYMNIINNKCINTNYNPLDNNIVKNTASIYDLSNNKNYHLLVTINYSLSQLKEISRFYNFKTSGTKKELSQRLFCFLYLSNKATKIQSIFRKHLVQLYFKYRGPAFVKRKLCINDSDFLSMEPVSDISTSQFVSFKDEDQFIYGFDILSFYNLIFINKQLLNPYNRREFSLNVIRNFKSLLNICTILNVPINIEIDNSEITSKQSVELRILGLFQNINALGNYSDASWFTTLNKQQCIKLIKELVEIWNYRSQITEETKRSICHPSGNPFRHFNMHYIQVEQNIEIIRQELLYVLENMVNCGIDKDSKTLGAYYVLGGLTLVNPAAASALPWLYQSVLYV
jgi:hypothetical protein